MDHQKPTHSPIIVVAYKYDGVEHRRWKGQLTGSKESMVQLTGEFDVEIEHSQLGTIARGTVSVEHYWTDRWYSVFRFIEPTGQLRNYYCNINSPPRFDGNILTFVDLDIDILVAPDFSYSILDQEEYDENKVRFGYPIDLQRRVDDTLVELIDLIEHREFPFDEPE